MVVDDDAGVRELLVEILQLSGLEVCCAANGRDALAASRAA
jgi:CheY-like chemotaxis protein